MNPLWALLATASSPKVYTSGTFDILPAVSGLSRWDLTVNGPLNLGTSGQWSITPLVDMSVMVKMWGAGGAGGGYGYTTSAATAIAAGTVTTSGSTGGAGGYSTGRMVLAAGITYIIQVGEGGSRTMSSTGGATYQAGGVANAAKGGTQGGGYSGIFQSPVSQGNAIMIAGGGGGGTSAQFTALTGLGGGGLVGVGGSGAQGGQAGTQTNGGAASSYNGATIGTALTGGMAANVGSGGGGMGGGGGGYYGGGGGNVGGGGGGSGFLQGTLTSASTTAASGVTPGNSGDSVRNGAGDVTAVGSAGTGGVAQGSPGRVYMTL